MLTLQCQFGNDPKPKANKFNPLNETKMKKSSKKSDIIPAELREYAKTLRTTSGNFTDEDIQAVQKGLDMVECGFKFKTEWFFDECWCDGERLTGITLAYTEPDNDNRYHEYETFDLSNISPKDLLRKVLDCKLSKSPGYLYTELYACPFSI